MHIYKYEAICSFMMAEMWRSTLRNMYTQNSKIKTDQPLVKRRTLFYFENELLFAIILPEQKKVEKVFLVKQIKGGWPFRESSFLHKK